VTVSISITVAFISASNPSLFTNLTAGTLEKVPGIKASIIEVVTVADQNAAADAFKYVWYAVIAFACLAVVVSCLTIDYGEYLTDDVARKTHGATVEGKGGAENEKLAEMEREEREAELAMTKTRILT
jgi:hypothetical protein